MFVSLRSERVEAIRKLENALGVTFTQLELYDEALTHTSYANERQGRSHNERLEFLGDAVVGLVISHVLFKRFPASAEGGLARAKANLVSASSMAQIAKNIGLGEALLLGRGELRSGGRDRDSILADALEALIGAVYLDQKWNVTCKMVERLWKSHLYELAPGDEPRSAWRDPKSALQEQLQASGEPVPAYRIRTASGPDHAKVFVSEVIHKGKVLAVGEGRSKKDAEQAAARKALTSL